MNTIRRADDPDPAQSTLGVDGTPAASAVDDRYRTLLIISDIRFLREGLAEVLSRDGAFAVIGTAADLDDAVEIARTRRPQVILLDAVFPNGLAAARTLGDMTPRIPIVALALTETEDDVIAWAEAGISGYVPRTAAMADLIGFLRDVVRGEQTCSTRVAAGLLRWISTASRGGSDARAGAREPALTAREAQVNLLSIPDATRAAAGNPAALDTNADPNSIYGAAISLCQRRRAMLLIAAPPPVNTVTAAVDWKTSGLAVHQESGTAFFPRLRLPDPANSYQPRTFAPSGVVAGLYARTDASRGVWKAPAGTEATLTGVQSMVHKLNDLENGVLNPLGLNCFRIFPDGRNRTTDRPAEARVDGANPPVPLERPPIRRREDHDPATGPRQPSAPPRAGERPADVRDASPQTAGDAADLHPTARPRISAEAVPVLNAPGAPRSSRTEDPLCYPPGRARSDPIGARTARVCDESTAAPEVRITIGMVEVHAAPPRPSPPRPGTVRQPGTSLAE